ncbi:MAG: hypothetical protein HY300_21075, partial [Verrucomicrobia bacterium]|nr:hypothetical protein [Verrucomicrobiota bacterium]
LDRLRGALAELQAECIAVPPFDLDYLRRGHAVHFRCRHPDVAGLRVDVMSVMRGVSPFPELWERRTALADADGTTYELLSLPDLVQAKKTQRDRDWPMLRRLLEADYWANEGDGPAERVKFWLRELRTPELLAELARKHPAITTGMTARRPLLSLVAEENLARIQAALDEEEAAERARDRAYWLPLKAELERLRHGR